MKKRLLSAVLVLLMLVAFVPVTAAAEEGKLYGEMPIYLGFPDVDYMAEEILKGSVTGGSRVIVSKKGDGLQIAPAQ